MPDPFPVADRDPQSAGGLPGWLAAAVDIPNPQPFDGHDPVSVAELTREQRAWRAVLHLLAVHGGHLRIPAVWAPDRVGLAVAGGWRYLSELAADGNDTILTCRFTRDVLAAVPVDRAPPPDGEPCDNCGHDDVHDPAGGCAHGFDGTSGCGCVGMIVIREHTGAVELDDAQVARAFGETPALVVLWRTMGMRWYRRDDRVETWSGTTMVGVQPVDADGHPAGPYVLVVNELTAADLAARDS